MSCMLFTFLYNDDFFFAFKFLWKSFKMVIGCNASHMVEVIGLIYKEHAHFIENIKEP